MPPHTLTDTLLGFRVLPQCHHAKAAGAEFLLALPIAHGRRIGNRLLDHTEMLF